MAPLAVHGRAREPAIDVTGRALCVLMRTGQRELRGAVVERRALPIHGCMARGAVVRESGGRVAGILRGIEIGHVAAKTVRGSARESSSHVAGDTR